MAEEEVCSAQIQDDAPETLEIIQQARACGKAKDVRCSPFFGL